MMSYEEALKAYVKEQTGHDADYVSVSNGEEGGCDTCDYGSSAAEITYRVKDGEYRDLPCDSVDQLLKALFRVAREEARCGQACACQRCAL